MHIIYMRICLTVLSVHAVISRAPIEDKVTGVPHPPTLEATQGQF